jgi:AcrR family transcriptional regulator
MRARQDSVEQTRRQITEATMRLHERVGPAATTVSAIAQEAGVTRLTV